MANTKPLLWLGRLAFVALALFPFLWMLSTALKGPNESLFSLPPQWWPQDPTLENFRQVWQQLPLLQFLGNSAVVTAIATLSNLLNAVLAGLVLSRYRFKLKPLFYLLVLATMFVPFQVLMIPLYVNVMQSGLLHWGGKLGLWLALALPFGFSGFGVLMVKQALDELSPTYEEAAMLDGASPLSRLFLVTLPLLRPTLITLGIFSFIAVWGDFLWASLLTNEPHTLTLTTGLVQLQGQFASNWRNISAGTCMMLLPSLFIFFTLQRYLIGNSGGVKG